MVNCSPREVAGFIYLAITILRTWGKINEYDNEYVYLGINIHPVPRDHFKYINVADQRWNVYSFSTY